MSFLLSQQNSEGIDEFAIDLRTGEMTVRNCELLDFDNKKTSYSIVVEARDNYREGITRKYFVNYLFCETCFYFILISSRQFVHLPTSQHHVRTVSIKLYNE